MNHSQPSFLLAGSGCLFPAALLSVANFLVLQALPSPAQLKGLAINQFPAPWLLIQVQPVGLIGLPVLCGGDTPSH